MKTTLALLAIPFLAAAPLTAQDAPKEGQELLDLFEKMHREGATEADLRKILGDKALLDLDVPEAPQRREEAPEIRRKIERKIQREGERGAQRDGERGEARNPREPEAPTWKIGLAVEPVAPFIREHLGLDKNEGVRVVDVADGSPAARLGLKENDIIFSAGDKKLSNLEELKEVVERAGREGQSIKLGWLHKGERKSAEIRPEGPPPVEGERKEGAEEAPQRPAMMRRLEEMARRMERQQREIEELRREVERLKRAVPADE